ncbi:MAG: hypothetical protein PHW60_02175 [Kiritimatiellae bacterium]|nr:hypothetical protein [Kiritimatiellia bacterium]
MISTTHRLLPSWVSGVVFFLIPLLLAGCVSQQATNRNRHNATSAVVTNAPLAGPIATNGITADMAAELDRHWGIRVESLRLSAHGHILDFRYRVLDSDKARVLADRTKEACLINEVTGERLKVPNMPKVGALRSTAIQLERNRIYLVLFANPGSRIKSGHRVTVEIGEFKAEHLIVE